MNEQDISQKMLKKMNNTDEPLIIALTTHLYTEYWINRIIEEKSPIGKEILKSNNYTFAIKLNLIYSMCLIPQGLYKNIKKLNNLRNKFSHQLNYDFSEADLDYDLSGIMIFKKDGSYKLNDGDIGDVSNFKTIKEKLYIINLATYGWICLHARDTLGIEIKNTDN